MAKGERMHSTSSGIRRSAKPWQVALLLVETVIFVVVAVALVAKAVERTRLGGFAGIEVFMIATPFAEIGVIVGGVAALWYVQRASFAARWAALPVFIFIVVNSLIWVPL